MKSILTGIYWTLFAIAFYAVFIVLAPIIILIALMLILFGYKIECGSDKEKEISMTNPHMNCTELDKCTDCNYCMHYSGCIKENERTNNE